MVFENGDIGRIEGRIGIGAAFVGALPLVQVARLDPNGRYLEVVAGSGVTSVLTVFACTGAGRGDAGGLVALLGCGGAGDGSRTIDFRNHDDLWLVSVPPSEESRGAFESMLVCLFLFVKRDDLGRRGSMASVKYSCLMASADVGRLLGSHIKHCVTKLLKAVGHCGGRRIVSIE